MSPESSGGCEKAMSDKLAVIVPQKFGGDP
jgi:hypothetical protein